MLTSFRLLHGDCREVLKGLPEASVQCCVTSPPYWALRDYGTEAQIGLEASPAGYVTELVAVFREVRRVLRPDGVLWLNLGDSYAGNRSGSLEGSTLDGSRASTVESRRAEQAMRTVSRRKVLSDVARAELAKLRQERRRG